MNSSPNPNFKKSILEVLFNSDGLRFTDLNKTIKNKGTLSKHLGFLVKENLLKRQPREDPKTGKIKKLYIITDKGKDVLLKLEPNKNNYLLKSIYNRKWFREKYEKIFDFYQRYEIEREIIPKLMYSIIINNFEQDSEYSKFQDEFLTAIYFIKMNSVTGYPKNMTSDELFNQYDIKTPVKKARIELYIKKIVSQFNFQTLIINHQEFYLDHNSKLITIIDHFIDQLLVEQLILHEINSNSTLTINSIKSEILKLIFDKFRFLHIGTKQNIEKILLFLIKKKLGIISKELIGKEKRKEVPDHLKPTFFSQIVSNKERKRTQRTSGVQEILGTKIESPSKEKTPKVMGGRKVASRKKKSSSATTIKGIGIPDDYTKADWEQDMTQFFNQFLSKSFIRYLISLLEKESPSFLIRQHNLLSCYELVEARLENVEEQERVQYFLERFRWGVTTFDQLAVYAFLITYLEVTEAPEEY